MGAAHLTHIKVEEVGLLAAGMDAASKEYTSAIGTEQTKAELKGGDFIIHNVFEAMVKQWGSNEVKKGKKIKKKSNNGENKVVLVNCNYKGKHYNCSQRTINCKTERIEWVHQT